MNKSPYLDKDKLCFKKLGIIISFIACCWAANAKVLIITHVHSRPDFIALHDKTFKAFLQDDYEYVVFNDAPNDQLKQTIEETCDRLGIRGIRIPQDLHMGRISPSKRHIDGIHYSLEQVGFEHDGIVLMIDSDMFLVRPFSAEKYMEQFQFIGGYQSRSDGVRKIIYTSPCLVFMDMRTLPNKKTISFEDGIIEGFSCDTGGSTFYYFINNPQLKLKLYYADSTDLLPKNKFQLQALGFDENSMDFIINLPTGYGVEFHGENNFLHYYAGGSNWAGYSAEFNQRKTQSINDYIDQQIKQYAHE